MSGSEDRYQAPPGLLRIEDCLDDDGGVVLPPGTTLISLIDRNVANVGDTIAYRFLDFSRGEDPIVHELTWAQLGARLHAIAARVQQHADRGDRVAILAPQGLDYIAGFFGAIKAGAIAVPLFAPELPGHAERLDVALRDARPSVVLTTSAAVEEVRAFLATLPEQLTPELLVLDDIPDSAGATFTDVHLDVHDVCHLQYTSGATRPPVGVELTHLAVGTNLLQMILSIDLLDRTTHGVSWLPLYHDMGLSMIGFPAVYGGHSTLMSPAAFIRRPQRWIRALSDGCRIGRVVTAAPNFAYEWAAARGRPDPGEDIDLSTAVLIIGSEPVSPDAIAAMNEAFAPHGLPATAMKPSYGIAEATLFVSTIAPEEQAEVAYLDRTELTRGRAVECGADAPEALPSVSCGQVARSLWVVIVDPETGEELPDARVGEIWLQGNNIGRGYWDRPAETAEVFGATLARRLADGSHADGAADSGWLRSTDVGMYLDGELHVTGRLADLVVIDGAVHYPHDLEDTVAESSAVIRRGYVVATTDADGELVIVAERAAGTRGADPGQVAQAVGAAVAARHGLKVADLRLLPAGAIPRTTSGKLARRACRAEYLAGALT